MKLSFNKKLGTGKPTGFRSKIIAGVKLHSFMMSDKRNVGDIIEFDEDGIPFFLDKIELAEFWKRTSDGIAYPLIAAIEKFEMKFFDDIEKDENGSSSFVFQLKIGDLQCASIVEVIAMFDGFDNYIDFITYFDVIRKRRNVDTLTGQLIHWKLSTVYDPENAVIYNQ